MKYYVAMISLGLLCCACARSGALPSDSLDCENGTLVRLMASDNCVFETLNVPELCPIGVPFQYDLRAHRICSSDPVLSRSATVAIRDAALREQSSPDLILDLEQPPEMESAPVMDTVAAPDSVGFDSDPVGAGGATMSPVASD